MEKLLKSGGAFGGNKNLSNTFKKIRGEIAAGQDDDIIDDDDLDSKHHGESLQQSNLDDDMNESDMDMALHDNSKLLLESPGQNTLVQNQINQLTDDGGYEQQQQVMVDDNGLSDGQIDLENLTESQIMALQEQANEQEFGEDGEGEGEGEGVVATGEEGEEDDDEDVIDVDNPEDLAKKGLRRIQIEGDE